MYRPYLNRSFGVEMEMNEVNVHLRSLDASAMQHEMANLIGRTRVNFRTPSYYKSDGTTWDLKLDGSCGYGTRCGYELAAPALYLDESANNSELKKICDYLVTTVQPRISSKCGLHVHVDASDFTWREMQKLVTMWMRYEPFFYGICPKSRRNAPANRTWYCRSYRASKWWDGRGSQATTATRAVMADNEHSFQSYGQSLYRESSLNISGWWRHGRIEFRLGGGTVNYEKVVRWVQLLVGFVGRVKSPVAGMEIAPAGDWPTRGVANSLIFKALGLEASDVLPASEVAPESVVLTQWVEARIRKFADRVPAHLVSAMTPLQQVGVSAAATMGTASLSPQQRAWVTRRAREAARRAGQVF